MIKKEEEEKGVWSSLFFSVALSFLESKDRSVHMTADDRSLVLN